MRRVVKAAAAVTGRMCMIGFSIQIVLGLFWMLCNFAGFQKFGDTYLYEQVSKDFLCDPNVGILYPVLLLFARGIEGLFGVSCHCVMYALQLAVALYAAHAFLQAVYPSGRPANLWGSLAMLTFPMAMQCHLAVLPESLTGSMMLLELAWTWAALKGGKEIRSMDLARIAVFWLVGALLQPEYLYLGAVPVALVFLYGLVCFSPKKPTQIANHLIIVVSFAGIILGMNDLTQTKDACGRGTLSLNAALFSRFSWSTADKTYEDWPQEVRQCLDPDQVRETFFYADNMLRVAGRAVEESYGAERAEELFGQVARLSYSRYRDRILHEMAWDAAGYVFSPPISVLLLRGRGYDSYTTRNYDLMMNRTPALASRYFHYSGWWFGLALVMAAALQALFWLRALGRLRGERGGTLFGRKAFFWGILLLTGVGMTIWYTMRGGGMFDYKKTIVIGCLWTAWASTAGVRAAVWRNE